MGQLRLRLFMDTVPHTIMGNVFTVRDTLYNESQIIAD